MKPWLTSSRALKGSSIVSNEGVQQFFQRCSETLLWLPSLSSIRVTHQAYIHQQVPPNFHTCLANDHSIWMAAICMFRSVEHVARLDGKVRNFPVCSTLFFWEAKVMNSIVGAVVLCSSRETISCPKNSRRSFLRKEGYSHLSHSR